MRIVLAAVGAACAAALCGGCGSSSAGGGREVVASFYPLAWAAEAVGSGALRVQNLTPPGAGVQRFGCEGFSFA